MTAQNVRQQVWMSWELGYDFWNGCIDHRRCGMLKNLISYAELSFAPHLLLIYYSACGYVQDSWHMMKCYHSTPILNSYTRNSWYMTNIYLRVKKNHNTTLLLWINSIRLDALHVFIWQICILCEWTTINNATF